MGFFYLEEMFSVFFLNFLVLFNEFFCYEFRIEFQFASR